MKRSEAWAQVRAVVADPETDRRIWRNFAVQNPELFERALAKAERQEAGRLAAVSRRRRPVVVARTPAPAPVLALHRRRSCRIDQRGGFR
jgi:hypothetical protein